MTGYLVTEQRRIAADSQRLFDIVADPAMHPVIDGSGSVRAAHDGHPERLALGARFGMDMKLGAPYHVSNVVLEFEDGRRIAWRHFNGHVWRYIFTSVEGGTLVTEQWDARPAHNRILLRLLGFPARNRRGMRATLARLEQLSGGEVDEIKSAATGSTADARTAPDAGDRPAAGPAAESSGGPLEG